MPAPEALGPLPGGERLAALEARAVEPAGERPHPASVTVLAEDEPVAGPQVRAVVGVADPQHELVDPPKEAELERDEADRRIRDHDPARGGPGRAAGVDIEVDHLDVP